MGCCTFRVSMMIAEEQGSASAQLADAAGRGDGDASTARRFTFTFEGAPRSGDANAAPPLESDSGSGQPLRSRAALNYSICALATGQAELQKIGWHIQQPQKLDRAHRFCQNLDPDYRNLRPDSSRFLDSKLRHIAARMCRDSPSNNAGGISISILKYIYHASHSAALVYRASDKKAPCQRLLCSLLQPAGPASCIVMLCVLLIPSPSAHGPVNAVKTLAVAVAQDQEATYGRFTSKATTRRITAAGLTYSAL